MAEKTTGGQTVGKYRGPRIIFEHVCKQYPNGVSALEDVSFKIDSGEFVFLTGHSGSGKSTLIKLLLLELRQNSGKIFVGNDDLSEIGGGNVPKYRRRIGVVFQDFRLIPTETVYENIAFAMEINGSSRSEINRSVDSALELVGLLKRKNDKVNCLSGGEQQRVAIARAVVNLPGLIIADEPTGNLDPENSIEIMNLLKKINNLGATVIIATHESGIVKNSKERVIRLNHGRKEPEA